MTSRVGASGNFDLGWNTNKNLNNKNELSQNFPETNTFLNTVSNRPKTSNPSSRYKPFGKNIITIRRTAKI